MRFDPNLNVILTEDYGFLQVKTINYQKYIIQLNILINYLLNYIIDFVI